MCGEKVLWLFVIELIKGSPPRVRGKEDFQHLWLEGFGITPACAGKSRAAKRRWVYVWDHPRVCGEKFPRKTR